jgi:AraC-like DNA-binding protein
MIALYHADDRRVMETGEPVCRRIEPVANPDGTVNWHITSKFPLFDAAGHCIGLAGIMRDLDRDARSWRPHRRMSKVLDHIAQHYADPLSIRDLAGVAGLSISQFDRRFRAAFGQTPSRFLIRYRLTRASQLLVESDETISRIALETGFYDHSHFTREFRKMFGLSPGRYRQEHVT